MGQVKVISPHDGLTRTIATAIFELMSLVWPATNKPVIEDVMASWKALGMNHFVVEGDEPHQLLAHAMIFRREIMTELGPLVVGALGGVCVHPDFRGHGYGADVVLAAFDYLPKMDVEVALFQTSLPQFYEKLGCREVANRFVNGNEPGNPFWEPNLVIYPAAFPWAEGTVDIKGTGF